MAQPNHNATLDRLIVQQIVESVYQKITFAQFMELALYHPQWGYYAAKPRKIGGLGDFVTAPHFGAVFGELLAEQFVQFWELLDRPRPFTLVEMGAGQGVLAVDILRHIQLIHPVLWRSLDYVVVERSPILIQEQRSQFSELRDQGCSITWKSLDQIAPNTITGCFFSNELVDAFPVHRVMRQAGTLQEIYVTATMDDQGSIAFSEVTEDLSTVELLDYFRLVGIDLTSENYPDG